jgi:hypothetical protein
MKLVGKIRQYWLGLTDRRLLMIGSGPLGGDPTLERAEPIQRVRVTPLKKGLFSQDALITLGDEELRVRFIGGDKKAVTLLAERLRGT